MQISRHWRMNSQRYRLEGVRFVSGEVSLQKRPTHSSNEARAEERVASSQSAHMRAAAPAGR